LEKSDPLTPGKLARLLETETTRESYDAAASGYAEHLFSELDHKPLDRHLLNRFAEELRGGGTAADLGCGPGHVTSYLHAQGLSMVGVDLSPGMVGVARARVPDGEFRVGDMSTLDFADGSLAGVVSFYSIVHFDGESLSSIFREMRRVLQPEGLVLMSFHIGSETVHLDDLFGAAVSLYFRFHQPEAVIASLCSSGFRVVEKIEREPYAGAEYPSRRCYLLARAIP
jgi:ubiquinone/menaquinone biosynthesis C-methylase UbiE